jgi:hypothetical protein
MDLEMRTSSAATPYSMLLCMLARYEPGVRFNDKITDTVLKAVLWYGPTVFIPNRLVKVVLA